MQNTLTKNEIISWVDFLYKDLLTHRVLIGGYFFNFDQMSAIKCKMNTLEDEIRRLANEMNISYRLRGKSTLKSVTDTLENEEVATKKRLDFMTDWLGAYNEYNEYTPLPVTYDELKYVHNRLQYCKDEVDFFYDFVMEEIQKVEDKDLNEFYMFVNDFLEEIKESLKTEKPVMKVKVVKKEEKDKPEAKAV